MSYTVVAEEALIKELGVFRLRKVVRALQIWPNPDDCLPQIYKKIARHLKILYSALKSAVNTVMVQCPGLVRKNVSPITDPRVLLPPVNSCLLGCEKELRSKNGDAGQPAKIYYNQDTSTKCTIFDIDGSHRPCWRYTLHCKKCRASYGFKTYYNPATKRHYLYVRPVDKQTFPGSGYVMVSREAVFTNRLCWLITQDAFVKQCSFQSFSTAVTNTYGILEDYNRKQIIEAFFKYHIEIELHSAGLVKNGFATEHDWDDVLAVLNKHHYSRLLPHTCFDLCSKRGCRWVTCIDGNWKLNSRLCAFKVNVHHVLYPYLHFPDACTVQPESGKMFCAEHVKVAESNGIPSTITEKKAIAELLAGKPQPASGQPEQMHALPGCTKNKGVKAYDHPRSRGYLFFVTAGGIIRFFRPLYGSESNSQVFYAAVQYLYLMLKDTEQHPIEAWSKVILCYDDMCHLDGLTQANLPLPLPAPYDKMWATVTKVIDRFHLKNHVRKVCHTVYDPEKMCLFHGNDCKFNTEAAEQVFSWLRHFSPTVFNMAKDRQELLLWLMSKLHNAQMENAMAKGKFPMHSNGRRRRFTM